MSLHHQHVCVLLCSRRTEGSAGIQKTVVTDACEVLCEYQELNPDRLREKSVLLTTELSLWPTKLCF